MEAVIIDLFWLLRKFFKVFNGRGTRITCILFVFCKLCCLIFMFFLYLTHLDCSEFERQSSRFFFADMEYFFAFVFLAL